MSLHRAAVQYLNDTRPAGAPKMPEPLTAADLHALVESLFAEWPECRPEGLCFGPTAWGDGWLRPGIPTVLPVPVAAALIRVAVEDALLAEPTRCVEIASLTNRFLARTFLPHDIVPVPGGGWLGGPTPLHALIAAARAVAGSRK